MKIKVKYGANPDTNIEIDGKDVSKIDLSQRILYFNKIVERIQDLPNWFDNFVMAICFHFGNNIVDEDYDNFISEVDL